ncbi:hypothetical protein KGF56_001314 [Candida oxycetoniae]|uniref:rRNA methyltransferase 1, mitochondrial n=1 Tax=Candida oxycetoniae TaxID=497107 RepID=A0AAI9WZ12_9ASCO|nr:uncharacterized protein KGF56_001314 [Candida oxycetoniae]KAI3405708.2 hypothetical protein KGF56_001314 [Candida oxycetoniae]
MISLLLQASEIRPYLKPHHPNKKNEPRSFQKNLPYTKVEVKPWEELGITKERFFKRKYGKMSDWRWKIMQEKIARQRRYRGMKKTHEEQKLKEEKDAMDAMDESGRRRRNLDGLSAQEIMYNHRKADNGTIRPGTYGTFFEYVYGTHSVKSVLLARKRSIFGLYTFNCEDSSIIEKAKIEYGVKVQSVRDKNALNILTKNGVHNGVVLKTKSLVVPYVKEVGRAENRDYTLMVEDKYGDTDVIVEEVTRCRNLKEDGEEKYPLALYLDEITDPQNIGSILRSAYFFGVDFVVIPSHSSAKLGPVANKASSGALDLMNIYQVEKSLSFLENVKKNGWTVIATSAKPAESSFRNKFIDLKSLKTALQRTPVMLVIGSEGKGVRTNIKLTSDYLVGIPQLGENDKIVDSLNVGVATGILIQSCL